MFVQFIFNESIHQFIFRERPLLYKTDHHDITEILLKVALNTITPNPYLEISMVTENYTIYL
jgi:hypothetical protein